MAGMELFGQEERNEVNEVLETGMLFRYNFDLERKAKWKAKEFEREIARFTGAKYCHTCSSGSTAVSLLLATSGVGAGDEVIVPPFTYIATIEAVLWAGAIPVFAEIDDTLNLSPEGIEAVITEKTKAVCLVHMCGSMARLDEIMDVCERKNILLLEDTAQALGTFYKGKHVGLYGKAGTFSFDFFKIITAGEGGAIFTNDEDIADKMHMLSDHGHDHIGDNRGAEQHPILGFNFRIGEMNAAVGLAQIRKLDYILEMLKKNKTIMKEALSKYKQITFRNIPDPEGDSATFLNFFLPDEKTTRSVVNAMREEDVGGLQYWYDNNFHYIKNWHHLKDFSVAAKLPVQVIAPEVNYNDVKTPKSDDLMSRLISLVVNVSWSEDELNIHLARITNALDRFLK